MNGHQPAFPTPQFYDERQVGCTPGLTKREFFAAVAMHGLLSSGLATPTSSVELFAVELGDRLMKRLMETGP